MTFDSIAERAVLGGICQYGHEAWLDVSDLINTATCFYDSSNQAFFNCLKVCFERENLQTIDQSVVMSVAKELGFGWLFEGEELKHVRLLFNTNIKLEVVRHLAAKIRKLEIARLLKSQLEEACVNLEDIKGSEPLAQIMGIAENAVFDLSSLCIDGSSNTPKLISDGYEEYIQYLIANPVEMIGISTGLPIFDNVIGGGLQRACVTMLGARSGVGKSMLSDHLALHIAGKLEIPVLYLDTEMQTKRHWDRISARLSRKTVTINDFKTGQFGKDPLKIKAVMKGMEWLKGKPYHYLNVSGKPFEEILSIMRRWVQKEVGFNENGSRKDCLIIYDYLKLMSGDGIGANMAEYQILGFMMTSMHNFSVRYDVPMVSLIQLNRDGIDLETQGAISGSDRVVWLASNVAIFKEKDEKEIAGDNGEENGTHKIVVVKTRDGEGMRPGDYINILMQGKYAYIEEKDTHLNLQKKQKSNQSQPPEFDIEPVNIDDIDDTESG